ncbi:transcription factor bHLH113 isoform X2 [Vigna unguiculata]|uniref:Myc-type n=1 Tax=Vigna unguiculata TaxID=3917 RepID=A0A4D6N6K4_VIGUN|nr:transcription factor bHLH113 isoform X2 [Vigna unguiculata]QCE08484.1 Myc-type [Vigna unguiculata]
MDPKDEFELTGTTFSQLLFGDDHDATTPALSLPHHHCSYDQHNLSASPLFSFHKPPKMLCFGTQPHIPVTPQKSVITSSDSSSASSSNHTNTAFTSLPKSTKKRNGLGQEPVAKVGVGGQRQTKKTKAENPTSTGHAKRKEKLGERIAALQQLVSPFGKTDTASVLHEAMGYIRFLHDQVQVLCSPYLQSLSSSHHQQQHGEEGENSEGEVKKDLRSRGLCLIPVGCTVHVASSNGADFWSPGAIGKRVSPSGK